jgi:alpha-galactosidase
MPIQFDAQTRSFKLDTVSSSYILRIHETGRLLQVYYGSPIPDATVSDRDQRRGTASFSPNDPHGPFTPDGAPMEYGCNGAGDFRISALSVRNGNGNSTTDIRYKDHRIFAGKSKIPGLPATYVNDDSEADTL